MNSEKLLNTPKRLVSIAMIVVISLCPVFTDSMPQVEYPGKKWQEVIFGSFLVIQKLPGVVGLMVNNQAAGRAKIAGQVSEDFNFFSIGYDHFASIRGLKKNGTHWNWFEHRIPVIRPDISKAKLLDLPKSTRKKLKDVSKERRARESKIMKDVLTNYSGPIKGLCHSKPVHNIVTSHMGKPRKLPSGSYYYHPGVDLRAWEGEPIFSSGSGRVALAAERGVSGNSVVIDHGGGLFTKYYHLSQLDVEVGETIPEGHWLGLSGSTGRVTAAHLHWEVIYRGKNLDPMRFLSTLQSLPPCKR